MPIAWQSVCLVPAYTSCQQISLAKKKDLLSLLSARIISPDYDSFYASLPSAAVATDRLPEPTMEEEEPSSSDTEVEEPADVAGMASTVPVGRRRASLQRSAEKPADVTMASPTKKRVHSEQSQ